MELIFIFMSTAVGTVIGSIAGVFTAQKIHRTPSAESAALQMQLRASEASLAEAAANLEGLRRQVTERDRALEARVLELKAKQEQLDQLVNAAPAARTEGEPSAGELAVRAAALIEQCSELEARARQERSRVSEEASRHLSALEAQLEAERQQVQESVRQIATLTIAVAECQQRRQEIEDEHRRAQEVWGEQIGRLTAEMQQSQEQCALAESQLAVGKERIGSLEEQVVKLTTASAETSDRKASIEGQLAAERARSEDLAAQLDDLKAEAMQAGERNTGLEAHLTAAQAEIAELSTKLEILNTDHSAALERHSELAAELAAERAKSEELAGRIAEMGGESTEVRDRCAALVTEFAAERENGRQLADQVARLTVQLAMAQEEGASLEERLNGEQERSQGFASRIAGMNDSIAQLETKLEEERQSAAQGMHLLSVAQDNLTRVFKALAIETHNGNGSAPPEPPQPPRAAQDGTTAPVPVETAAG